MKIFLSLLSLFIICIYPVSAQTDKGLIAYWNFCDCQATDKAGNGHNGGIINDPECIQGISGDALKFSDAARSYILVDKDIKLDSPAYTIAAWLYVDKFSGYWDPVISRMRNSQDPYSDVWNISLDQSGTINYWYYDSFGQRTAQIGKITPKKWQFLVLSVNNGEGKIYIDNILQGTFTTGLLKPENTLPICIACNDQNQPVPNHFFNGALDEIRIYNRAITSNDREDLFKLRAPDPQMKIFPSEASICQGDSIHLEATLNVESHQWSPSTGLSCINCPDPIATPLTTTQYTVIATDFEGCQVQRSITVNVDSLFLKTNAGVLNINQSETASLSISTNARSVKWTPTQGLNCDTCINPKASPATTTTYYITAENLNGCTKVDSIKVIVNSLKCAKISGVINHYSSVTQISNSKTFVTVSDTTGLKKDAQVLLIQMQGAEIDTTNTAKYGIVKDIRGAGDYEFAVIAGVSGSTITFTAPLTGQNYDVNGKIQLVTMPEYGRVIVRDSLTAAPWNGSTGGILALAASCVALEGKIDVSGKGFRGGAYHIDPLKPEKSDSLYATSLLYFGIKGEGIAGYGNGINVHGRGAPANGGGGGNSHNGGGGGGSNTGIGGKGGFGYEVTTNYKIAGGLGGSFTNISPTKIFLGGGGGAGQVNDGHGSPGGAGGGIIIIRAENIENQDKFTISADGQSAKNDNSSSNPDGCGGGGAGGSVVIDAIFSNNIPAISLKGGNGGSQTATIVGHGTGGGGGGGILLTTDATTYSSAAAQINGGAAGSALEGGTYGATAGTNGTSVKITQTTLAGVLKTIESNKCLDCYPTIQTAQQLCSPATFTAKDEIYLLKSVELDNAGSNNIGMQLLTSLPSNEVIGTLTLIDPTKPGKFLLRGINTDDNTVTYESQVYPVPAPAISATGANLTATNTQATDVIQWFYNGAIIPGATAKTHKALQSGEYYIEATNIYGCKGTSAKSNIIISGVEEIVKDGYFALYPNPSSEEFFIESTQLHHALITIEITNIIGESVFKTSYQASGSIFKTAIPVSHLVAGTYFVHITSGTFKKVYKIVRN